MDDAIARATEFDPDRFRLRNFFDSQIGTGEIDVIFGALANVKHVFVVDDDIDVTSDEQIEWALSTRFRADRDLVVQSGFRVLPLDPSLDGQRTVAKAGFDPTFPFGQGDALALTVPEPPASRPFVRRFGRVR